MALFEKWAPTAKQKKKWDEQRSASLPIPRAPGLACVHCSAVGKVVANKCTGCGKWQSMRGHVKGARRWSP